MAKKVMDAATKALLGEEWDAVKICMEDTTGGLRFKDVIKNGKPVGDWKEALEDACVSPRFHC